jgi:serpin B
LAPDVPPADAAEIVVSDNQLGIDVARVISAGGGAGGGAGGNSCLSPYSLILALAMVDAGAAGQTWTQLRQALHTSLPEDRFHTAFDGLDLALTGRPAAAPPGTLELHIADRVFAQRELHIEEPFLDTLAEDYGAGLALVDFGDTEPTRMLINAWVAQATAQRIPALLDPGTIDASTRMVIADAIYFKGDWMSPFKAEDTLPAPFTRPGGSQVTAQMMSQTLLTQVGQGAGYQAVELPYAGGQLAMLLVLPDDLAAFEGTLSSNLLGTIAAGLAPQSVTVGLPKFELNTAMPGLAQALEQLGVVDLFSDQADLSGIDGQHDLQVSHVVQKTYLRVDEKGSEAAAATGGTVVTTAVLSSQLRIVFNRPFLYFLRDRTTGAVLFYGRVADPTA